MFYKQICEGVLVFRSLLSLCSICQEHNIVTVFLKSDHHVSNQETLMRAELKFVLYNLVLLPFTWEVLNSMSLKVVYDHETKITVETNKQFSFQRMPHNYCTLEIDIYLELIKFFNEIIWWNKSRSNNKTIDRRKPRGLTSVRPAHGSDSVLWLKPSSLDCWSSCSEVWQNRDRL